MIIGLESYFELNHMAFAITEENNIIKKTDENAPKLVQFYEENTTSAKISTQRCAELSIPKEVSEYSQGTSRIAFVESTFTRAAYHDAFYSFYGKYESAPGGLFELPRSMAFDSKGNIYVADTDNHRIQKFDSNRIYQLSFGMFGVRDGEFNSPHDITIDSDDNIYVADTGNDRIQKFNSDGVFLSKFGVYGDKKGEFDFPRGITLDASGNIYVADTGNDRIQKFNSDGVYKSEFGTLGDKKGEFDFPRDIALDSSGNIYVVDTGNDRIQKFNSDGVYQSEFGTHGGKEGEFDVPRGMALDPTGNIYVADTDNHRIQKFNSDGVYQSEFGVRGDKSGEFISPHGIVFDHSGNIYVADTGNARIQKFNPVGIYQAEFGIRGTYGNSSGKDITTDLNLLTGKFPTQLDLKYFQTMRDRIKETLPNSDVMIIGDEEIHDGSIFRKDGSNAYDVLFFLHSEYVTQTYYDNMIKFLNNGGSIVLLDANTFYAKIQFDPKSCTVTLIKGHDWEFDGKAARASVSEGFMDENTKWFGSNYIVNALWSDVRFENNPFNYTHFEENYVTNPNAEILIDYKVKLPESSPVYDYDTYLDWRQTNVSSTTGLRTDMLLPLHMNDTTSSFGSTTFKDKQIQAEFVSPTSQLVHKQIDVIALKLRKIGSPTGTAQIGVFNDDLSVKKLFGTIDSAIIANYYTDYSFSLPKSKLYTIEAGDRIGIKYSDGDNANYIETVIDTDTAEPFDGTNSFYTYYTNEWLSFMPHDMYMVLGQTTSHSLKDERSIAMYELESGNGKVINTGLYSQNLDANPAFLNYLEKIILPRVLNKTVPVESDYDVSGLYWLLPGGEISGVKLDTGSKTLSVDASFTPDENLKESYLTLVIPKKVMDATSDNKMINFVVIVNGTPVPYEESSDDVERGLKIRVTGNSEIKIIGTKVMPEFNAGVVLPIIFIILIVLGICYKKFANQEQMITSKSNASTNIFM